MSGQEMVQAEGYWVPRDPGCRIEFRISGTRIEGYGAPGVRYNDNHGFPEFPGRVVLTLGGHHSKGRMPFLAMSVDAAEELVQLLAAAVRDAWVAQGAALEPIGFRDITFDGCACTDCDDEVAALLEAEQDPGPQSGWSR
ncbi:hypothetical protein NBRGN_045_00490 [Nocardia brasiliensis NBRC 14402]|uniref:hypothetical protein n=1 Tax=Nocardia brasiliensis TaxID=37326 RepID=UPI00045D1B5D|nr:hypothetical protein [Nocardia brasiliensis]ASF09848.1 hypothetical protein CEQ30_23595 [Nocardia brasiliensis]GAJ81949.1 hypothetical protein NBRGN_045_00490 [Nocardia brasiliensis NBRC 14402]SUB55077.1 Uncharacterised protein [Nocardia brasiliensis]